MSALFCRASGVTFVDGYPRNLADIAIRCHEEYPLPVDLVRDLDNPEDLNATAVVLEGRRLGWVPRDVAAEVAPSIDSGTTWMAWALFVAVDLDHRERPGLQLLLSDEPALARWAVSA